LTRVCCRGPTGKSLLRPNSPRANIRQQGIEVSVRPARPKPTLAEMRSAKPRLQPWMKAGQRFGSALLVNKPQAFRTRPA